MKLDPAWKDRLHHCDVPRCGAMETRERAVAKATRECLDGTRKAAPPDPLPSAPAEGVTCPACLLLLLGDLRAWRRLMPPHEREGWRMRGLQVLLATMPDPSEERRLREIDRWLSDVSYQRHWAREAQAAWGSR